MELSFAGDKEGLMDYLKKESEICPRCHDTGIIHKVEWSGTDDSYEVEIRCHCQDD